MKKGKLRIAPEAINGWWISLTCGLYWFSFAMMRPIVAVYAASLGIKGAALGLLLALYAVLPLLAAVPGGLIADRIGRVVVLRAGALAMLASGALFLAADGLWLLGAAQLLAGLGQMAVWLAVQVLITGPPGPRSERRYATFSLYMALGQIAAPLIAGVIADAFGYRMVFAGYMAASLLLTVSAWMCRDEDAALASGTARAARGALRARREPGASKRREQAASGEQAATAGRAASQSGAAARTGGFRTALGRAADVARRCAELARRPEFSVMLLATFTALFITDVRTAYLPLYLESLGMSASRLGLLISLGSLSVLFVRPLYPRLARRMRPPQLLLLTSAVSLLLLFVTPLLQGTYSLGLLIFATGLALGVNQPMTLGMISGSTQPDERGLGVGLRLMANRAAQLFSPLLLGAFTALAGLQAAFVLAGVVMLPLCLASVLLARRGERRATREPGEEERGADEAPLQSPPAASMPSASDPASPALSPRTGGTM
ncbi:MFS transporter [Saccharibacillus sp. CPCC 101409]|uniref:MFS transporter n=1 Tax=Saccharibacillus sp. CPCC 101409 TaxID=3058041 RepID=UPI00267164E1|nr:MFS transporter [Saccharibacillus sp. CPCC 101409]MDO3408480.1 MFS transporter [Saccharibacillus sp. CPCC 101409]